MGHIDLDAARAARAEQHREPRTVTFGGETFELPVELPAEYGWLLIDNDTKGALRLLFGDRFDDFWGHAPTREDLNELVTSIPKIYGFGELGESRASSGSSPNGSSRSRPNSLPATESTSAKRSSGRKRASG